MGEIAFGRVETDDRGLPFSPDFDDVYASRDGAYAQARFVFLGGNGLPDRWRGRDQFTILENGFGLGTNFLATLKAWREDEARSRFLHYVAIEGFPLGPDDIRQFAAPELRAEARELAAAWPMPTPGVHRLTFSEGRVTLMLYLTDAKTAAKRLNVSFDAFYPDGFSPKKNPEMWEPSVLKKLLSHARANATLATWCAAGAVRRTFIESGFEVRKAAGFGHKSQMTVGVFAPKFRRRRSEVFVRSRPLRPRCAAVIGAGLAGAAAAEHLARRGLAVTVIDAGCAVASGASAIRWGVAHAQPSADDNHLFRLTRSGLAALRQALVSYEDYYRFDGLFQLAKNDEEFEKWTRWFALGKPFAFPDHFLRLISQQEAQAVFPRTPARGGLWHEGAGLVSIAGWVRARMERSGANVLLNTRVTRLQKVNGRWHIFSRSDEPVAQVDIAVLCCGYESASLSGLPIALDRWKGRLSLLCPDGRTRFEGAVTGPGYWIQAPDGWSGIGATYESAEQPLTSEEAHRKNLAHLTALFPDMPPQTAAGFYQGFRCVASDRMPLMGSLAQAARDPSFEGLYISSAMGSRGSVFCELGARIIEADIFDEPMPIEQDLVDAVSVRRLLPKHGD